MTSENQIQKYDETLHSVSATLKKLADSIADTELGLRIHTLSEKTSPFIKGVEGPQRVKIPSVQLCQNSSNKIPAGTKPGQLYTQMNEIIGSEFRFIPVFMHRNRKRWGDDDKIECQSMDGLKGNKYGECKSCPYGQFVQGERPQCSAGSTYYVVSEELTNIYRIDFSKTSSKAGRDIQKMISPPTLWSQVFTLTADKVSTAKNNYYVLKTGATGIRTTEEVSKVCESLFDYFNANYKKMMLIQEQFASRGADSTKLAENASAVDVSDEEINFSDSV